MKESGKGNTLLSEKRKIERISAKKVMEGYSMENKSAKEQAKELSKKIRMYDIVALDKKKMEKVKKGVEKGVKNILKGSPHKKRKKLKKKETLLEINRRIKEIYNEYIGKESKKKKITNMSTMNSLESKRLMIGKRKKHTLIRKIQRNYGKKQSRIIERIAKRYASNIESKYNDENTRENIKQKLKEYMGIRFGIVYIRIKRRNIFATLTNIKRRVLRVVTAGGVRKIDERSKKYKRYKKSLIAREAIGIRLAKFCVAKKIRYINIFWYTFRINRAILNIIRGFPLNDILIGSIQYRRIRRHGTIRARARRRI